MRRTLSILLVAALALVLMPSFPVQTDSLLVAGPMDDIPGVPLPSPPITRSHSGPGQNDVFSVHLLEGSEFACSLSGLTGDLNADLYLWKPGSTTVKVLPSASVVASSANPGQSDEQIAYTVPVGQGGTYYVDVHAAGGSGGYSLIWDAPNDLPGVVLSPTGTTMTGSYTEQEQAIEWGTDSTDVFGVQLSPGDRLQVYLYPTVYDDDLSLEIHDSSTSSVSGASAVPVAESDGFPRLEACSYTAPEGQGGYYHIAIKAQRAGYVEYRLKYEVIDAGAEPSLRVSGDDRIKTAVQASQEAFPDGSDNVIVVTGYNWPDALSAAGYAGTMHCPILLTSPDRLSPETSAEIERLGANWAVVIGGEHAVSLQVTRDLIDQLGGGSVLRVSGLDRYETSYTVAGHIKRGLNGVPDGFFVATGADFPDALAAGAIAADYKHPMPILLVAPGDSLSALARQEITGMFGPSADLTAYVVGGTAAVSDGIARDLQALSPVANVRRLGGADRYGTADALVRWFSQNDKAHLDTIALAQGTNYPDALCAAGLQATSDSYLLLTPTNELPAVTRTFLQQNEEHIGTVRVIGGNDVVSDVVKSDAVNLVK